MTSATGVAIDKDGLMYVADGANIRTIDEPGIIRTIIGSQDSPRHWVPLPCYQAVNASEVGQTLVQIAVIVNLLWYFDILDELCFSQSCQEKLFLHCFRHI